MKLTKRQKLEKENEKLILEIRNKRLDNIRLAIQIPLTVILLTTAIITLVRHF